jgi:hypothetical protein
LRSMSVLRRKSPAVARKPSCTRGWPIRMPTGRAGGRVDFADRRLRCRPTLPATAPPRRLPDGMLDERQRRHCASRSGIHPSVQSLPAHAENHA